MTMQGAESAFALPPPDATAVFDCRGIPRTTVELRRSFSDEKFRAIIEVEDLEPQREIAPTTIVVNPDTGEGQTNYSEEWEVGMRRLNPPTVVASTHRELIDAAQRCVQVAVSSTTGTRGTPGEILMVYLRVAIGVRGALRNLGEEI